MMLRISTERVERRLLRGGCGRGEEEEGEDVLTVGVRNARRAGECLIGASDKREEEEEEGERKETRRHDGGGGVHRRRKEEKKEEKTELAEEKDKIARGRLLSTAGREESDEDATGITCLLHGGPSVVTEEGRDLLRSFSGSSRRPSSGQKKSSNSSSPSEDSERETNSSPGKKRTTSMRSCLDPAFLVIKPPSRLRHHHDHHRSSSLSPIFSGSTASSSVSQFASPSCDEGGAVGALTDFQSSSWPPALPLPFQDAYPTLFHRLEELPRSGQPAVGEDDGARRGSHSSEGVDVFSSRSSSFSSFSSSSSSAGRREKEAEKEDDDGGALDASVGGGAEEEEKKKKEDEDEGVDDEDVSILSKSTRVSRGEEDVGWTEKERLLTIEVRSESSRAGGGGGCSLQDNVRKTCRLAASSPPRPLLARESIASSSTRTPAGPWGGGRSAASALPLLSLASPPPCSDAGGEREKNFGKGTRESLSLFSSSSGAAASPNEGAGREKHGAGTPTTTASQRRRRKHLPRQCTRDQTRRGGHGEDGPFALCVSRRRMSPKPLVIKKRSRYTYSHYDNLFFSQPLLPHSNPPPCQTSSHGFETSAYQSGHLSRSPGHQDDFEAAPPPPFSLSPSFHPSPGFLLRGNESAASTLSSSCGLPSSSFGVLSSSYSSRRVQPQPDALGCGDAERTGGGGGEEEEARVLSSVIFIEEEKRGRRRRKRSKNPAKNKVVAAVNVVEGSGSGRPERDCLFMLSLTVVREKKNRTFLCKQVSRHRLPLSPSTGAVSALPSSPLPPIPPSALTTGRRRSDLAGEIRMVLFPLPHQRKTKKLLLFTRERKKKEREACQTRDTSERPRPFSSRLTFPPPEEAEEEREKKEEEKGRGSPAGDSQEKEEEEVLDERVLPKTRASARLARKEAVLFSSSSPQTGCEEEWSGILRKKEEGAGTAGQQEEEEGGGGVGVCSPSSSASREETGEQGGGGGEGGGGLDSAVSESVPPPPPPSPPPLPLYILYLEPSPSSSLHRFLENRSREVAEIWGPDPAHCYPPHCSLCGFFNCPDVEIVKKSLIALFHDASGGGGGGGEREPGEETEGGGGGRGECAEDPFTERAEEKDDGADVDQPRRDGVGLFSSSSSSSFSCSLSCLVKKEEEKEEEEEEKTREEGEEEEEEMKERRAGRRGERRGEREREREEEERSRGRDLYEKKKKKSSGVGGREGEGEEEQGEERRGGRGDESAGEESNAGGAKSRGREVCCMREDSDKTARRKEGGGGGGWREKEKKEGQVEAKGVQGGGARAGGSSGCEEGGPATGKEEKEADDERRSRRHRRSGGQREDRNEEGGREERERKQEGEGEKGRQEEEKKKKGVSKTKREEEGHPHHGKVGTERSDRGLQLVRNTLATARVVPRERMEETSYRTLIVHGGGGESLLTCSSSSSSGSPPHCCQRDVFDRAKKIGALGKTGLGEDTAGGGGGGGEGGRQESSCFLKEEDSLSSRHDSLKRTMEEKKEDKILSPASFSREGYETLGLASSSSVFFSHSAGDQGGGSLSRLSASFLFSDLSADRSVPPPHGYHETSALHLPSERDEKKKEEEEEGGGDFVGCDHQGRCPPRGCSFLSSFSFSPSVRGARGFSSALSLRERGGREQEEDEKRRKGGEEEEEEEKKEKLEKDGDVCGADKNESETDRRRVHDKEGRFLSFLSRHDAERPLPNPTLREDNSREQDEEEGRRLAEEEKKKKSSREEVMIFSGREWMTTTTVAPGQNEGKREEGERLGRGKRRAEKLTKLSSCPSVLFQGRSFLLHPPSPSSQHLQQQARACLLARSASYSSFFSPSSSSPSHSPSPSSPRSSSIAMDTKQRHLCLSCVHFRSQEDVRISRSSEKLLFLPSSFFSRDDHALTGISSSSPSSSSNPLPGAPERLRHPPHSAHQNCFLERSQEAEHSPVRPASQACSYYQTLLLSSSSSPSERPGVYFLRGEQQILGGGGGGGFLDGEKEEKKGGRLSSPVVEEEEEEQGKEDREDGRVEPEEEKKIKPCSGSLWGPRESSVSGAFCPPASVLARYPRQPERRRDRGSGEDAACSDSLHHSSFCPQALSERNRAGVGGGAGSARLKSGVACAREEEPALREIRSVDCVPNKAGRLDCLRLEKEEKEQEKKKGGHDRNQDSAPARREAEGGGYDSREDSQEERKSSAAAPQVLDCPEAEVEANRGKTTWKMKKEEQEEKTNVGRKTSNPRASGGGSHECRSLSQEETRVKDKKKKKEEEEDAGLENADGDWSNDGISKSLLNAVGFSSESHSKEVVGGGGGENQEEEEEETEKKTEKENLDEDGEGSEERKEREKKSCVLTTEDGYVVLCLSTKTCLGERLTQLQEVLRLNAKVHLRLKEGDHVTLASQRMDKNMREAIKCFYDQLLLDGDEGVLRESTWDVVLYQLCRKARDYKTEGRHHFAEIIRFPAFLKAGQKHSTAR